MNILGIGGPELILILLIMLIVAGPKRMIHWAYIVGTYLAKFRRMWAETVDVIQKEFDEAGVDVKLPRDVPTRDNLRRSISEQANRALRDVAEPMRETANQLDADVSEIKRAMPTTHTVPTRPTTGAAVDGVSMPPQRRADAPPDVFGTWSGGKSDDDKPGFGTWSGKTNQDVEE